METITLSVGEFGLATPHLQAWERILSALDQSDYGVLSDMMTAALAETPDDTPTPDQAREIIRPLLGHLGTLLPRAPMALAAFVEGCLRDADGFAIKLPARAIPTLADATRVVTALIDQNLFAPLLATAKNLWGRTTATGRRDSASDSAPA